jgi:hypothetical protein
MGNAQFGGSGWALLWSTPDGPLANQWAMDHTPTLTWLMTLA